MPADQTASRLISHDLRMHGTGVFNTVGLGREIDRFESHAALRARSRLIRLHLGVHGTDIFT